MENLYENVRRELTPENVKEALQLMLERINLPENEARIVGVKEAAGEDMVEVMRSVFPIVVEIQVEVVGKFGFTRNQEGLKEFLIRVNQLASHHEEILELLLRIRETYLPGFDDKKNESLRRLSNNAGNNDDYQLKSKQTNRQPQQSYKQQKQPDVVDVDVVGRKCVEANNEGPAEIDDSEEMIIVRKLEEEVGKLEGEVSNSAGGD